MSDNKKILLWGGGSQARIINEMLIELDIGSPMVIFDSSLKEIKFNSLARFINDIDELKIFLPAISHYVVCIGNEHGYARYVISQNLEKIGLEPLNLMHHTCYLDKTSIYKNGLIAMPFSMVHKFCMIGSQVIINSNATIEHESLVGNGVHIMSNASISGRAIINDYATIGTNATILPDITVGEGSFVGAGSVVSKNVSPYTVVLGNPAKFYKENKLSINQADLDAMF
jgi:sugar O-acyltransferase (sialic acid O-acetyltransferase NeuD family)